MSVGSEMDVLLGQDGGAGRHVAHERHVHHLVEAGLDDVGGAFRVAERVGERDGARLERIALDEPLLLKRLEVHMDRRRGGKAQALANLAHGGTVAFLPDALFNAIEHCLLTFRHFFGHAPSFPLNEQMF